MSVINEMLRDLEQRKAPDRSDLGASVLNESLIEARPSRLKKYLLILLIALTIGVTGFMFQKNTLTPSTESQELPVVLSANDDVKAIVSSSAKVEESSLNVKPKDVNPVGLVSPSSKTELPPSAAISERKPLISAQQTTIKPTVQANNTVTSNKEVINLPSAKRELTKSNKRSAQVSVVEQSIMTETAVKDISGVKTVVTKPNKDPVKAIKPEASSKPVVRRKASILPHERDQKMADESREQFETGDPRAAYRALYEFVEAYEVDQQSRIVLISYLLQDERVAEAGDVLVTTKVDLSPELRQLKARWYVAKGEHKLALHTLRESLPELHSQPEYFALLASYYQRFGYPEKAAETYAALVRFDDESANWWAGLAIALDSSQQYQEAVVAYQRALDIPELSQELFEYIENRLSLLIKATSR